MTLAVFQMHLIINISSVHMFLCFEFVILNQNGITPTQSSGDMTEFSYHFMHSTCSSNHFELTHPQVVQNYCQLVGSTYLSNNEIPQFWHSHSICFSLLAKKKNKKGKTLSLNEFLVNDGSGSAPPSYPSAKTTSWADETDDMDGDGE